jgi:hypothetical protein
VGRIRTERNTPGSCNLIHLIMKPIVFQGHGSKIEVIASHIRETLWAGYILNGTMLEYCDFNA